MNNWRFCLTGIVVSSLAVSAACAAPVKWLAANVSPLAPLAPASSPGDATIRQVIRFEAAGSQVRLVLGNEVGKEPVRLRDIRIALLGNDGRIRAGTLRKVTFGVGHKDAIKLAPGATLRSDPIDLAVSRGATALISIYFPSSSGTGSILAREAYRIPGDHSDDPTLPGGRPTLQRTVVEQVEVQPTTANAVVVAIGDSITAGNNSTPLAHKSYPEQISDRFATLSGGDKWSVVNAGIGGNRVLHFGNGPSLAWRFDHDALNIAGVKAVIVLEGVNDIGQPTAAARRGATSQPVTAKQLISAYRGLISKAHAHGIRIYFGTILPYGAAAYFSEHGEATRQEVNKWIRSNHEADGFFDLAAAMRDPGSQPPRIKPELSGNGDPKGEGGLHPNDAGYGLMAAQITPAALSR